MKSDYDKLKSSGQLDQSYGSLSAALEVIELVKSGPSVSREQYDRLAEKFEQAMTLIEVLRTKIYEMESKKMPSKEEVESMSSMLDLLSKLDDNSIARIQRLGGLKHE